MLKKLLTFVLLCFVGVSYGYAQSGGVRGTVTDSDTGDPLLSANIYIPSLERGASTDAEGKYRIGNIEPGTYTLRFTYVGYKVLRKQVQIDDNFKVVNISLARTNSQLGETVVNGYRTETKTNSSTATSTVSTEDIADKPNVSVTQTLSGKVPGLNITTSNGQPGANSTIHLRGVGSINGNTEPLFILDGTPIDEDNFRDLNPNEIADVTVLKDAGATAIYGNRGANGVVLIRTKQGAYNTGVQVSYSGRIKSTSLNQTDYNFLSGPDLLRLERNLGVGYGATRGPQGGDVTDQQINNAPNTDWVDYFFDPNISNVHDLTISNGKENIKNLTSFGYTNEDGALNNSGLKRFNLRNNITGRSENRKFHYNINSSINYSDNETISALGTGGVNQNPVLAAVQSVPYLQPSDYPGSGQALFNKTIPLGLPFYFTPLLIIDKQNNFTNSEKRTRLIGSANGSYEFIPGLEGTVRLSGDYERGDFQRTQAPGAFNSILFAQRGNDTPGFATVSSTQTLHYQLTSNLQYETQFSDVHQVSAAAYFEINQGFYDFSSFVNNGLDPRTFTPGDGSGFVPDNASNDFFSNTVSLNKLQSGLLSYFGTLDYNYSNRYGVSLSLRRDASYRFSDSNRWGTFYSIAAHWNIANEAFMDDSPFNALKLRGSYGKTGNQDIVSVSGQFKTFAASSLTSSLFATGTGYKGFNSSFLSQIGNPNLQWENQFQSDIGIDFELFESRLRGTFDVYKKRTEDLFQNQPVSAITSVTSLRGNIGSLENRGVDFSLSYDVLRSRNGLNLTLGLVAAYNKQEITDLPQPDGEIVLNNYQIRREGGPLGEYYVIPYVGVNPEDGNLQFLDIDGNVTENPVPQRDRRRTGDNIYPDWQGSINLNADFKGVYLQTQWQYTLGVERYDFNYEGYLFPSNIGSFAISQDIQNRWMQPGDQTDVPRLNATNRSLDDFSDRFQQSSDYLRLRNATLGYRFPAELIDKVHLRGASVFVSGQNLITFTSWRGLDAESLNGFNGRLYPNPRILTAGLNIKF